MATPTFHVTPGYLAAMRIEIRATAVVGGR